KLSLLSQPALDTNASLPEDSDPAPSPAGASTDSSSLAVPSDAPKDSDSSSHIRKPSVPIPRLALDALLPNDPAPAPSAAIDAQSDHQTHDADASDAGTTIGASESYISETVVSTARSSSVSHSQPTYPPPPSAVTPARHEV